MHNNIGLNRFDFPFKPICFIAFRWVLNVSGGYDELSTKEDDLKNNTQQGVKNGFIRGALYESITA